MSSPIYLDYAATTPVDPAVAEVMAGFLTRDGVFANPASAYASARAASAAVEQARAQVAGLINAQPEEIVFTSGATEANNLAIKGAAQFNANAGRHIVTAKTEHKSVIDTCRQLEREGWTVTWLAPGPDGLLDVDELAAALRDDTVLVSVMQVNNEIGVIQDIAAIGRLTRERGVLLHVDAAQSAGKLALDLQSLEVDLLSLSAHKLYGPKGVGALYVRRSPRARLAAQIHGGGHERGLRSGTLPTHQIAGFGAACALAAKNRTAENERIGDLSRRLTAGIEQLPAAHRNGHAKYSVPGIVNYSFDGVDGDALLTAVTHGEDALAVSAGAACTSASAESSYVLRALGRDDEQAYASLRFSLGRWTTTAEIDAAVAKLQREVSRLRELSPLWPDQDSAAAPQLAVGV